MERFSENIKLISAFNLRLKHFKAQDLATISKVSLKKAKMEHSIVREFCCSSQGPINILSDVLESFRVPTVPEGVQF